MRRRAGAVGGLLVLFGALCVWLYLQPSDLPEAHRRLRVEAESLRPLPAPGRPASRPVPSPPPVEEEPAELAPQSERDRLFAEAMGWLHVRCFVGEELSALSEVDEQGWYSHVEREQQSGRRYLYSDLFDAQRAVAWSAPPGATATSCSVEQLAYAEVLVLTLLPDGQPGDGIGVTGCGASDDSDAEGWATLPVVAGAEPCALSVERYRDGRVIGAAVKIPTLQEGQQYRRTVRTHDLGTELVSTSDREVLSWEDGEVGELLVLPEPTPAERRAAAEERVRSLEAHLVGLEAARARAGGERTRELLDEDLARTQARLESSEAALDELD